MIKPDPNRTLCHGTGAIRGPSFGENTMFCTSCDPLCVADLSPHEASVWAAISADYDATFAQLMAPVGDSHAGSAASAMTRDEAERLMRAYEEGFGGT
jgi:hypothetical protein